MRCLSEHNLYKPRKCHVLEKVWSGPAKVVAAYTDTFSKLGTRAI